MSASNDVARMLTLVPWLLQRPGASLHEVAGAFGVDEATIRRDLGHLDFCGLPGLGGGDLFDVTIVGDRVVVSMADELRRPLRLTPREAIRLVLAVSTVEQAMGDNLPALRSAADKIRAAADLPPATSIAFETGATDRVADVRRAIGEGRRLRLTYQGRADEHPRERLVDPWQLDVTADGWYLHGHDADAGDHRSFRLDRIVDLEVLDELRRHPRPDHPLPEPRYQPDENAVEVELLLAPGARWLAEAVSCEQDDETSDGRRIVFHTDAPGWIARMVLMAAPAATVVRPVSLAEAVRELATATLRGYSDAAAP